MGLSGSAHALEQVVEPRAEHLQQPLLPFLPSLDGSAPSLSFNRLELPPVPPAPLGSLTNTPSSAFSFDSSTESPVLPLPANVFPLPLGEVSNESSVRSFTQDEVLATEVLEVSARPAAKPTEEG